MRRLLATLMLLVSLPTAAARAEPPRIIADIAPVQSLVAMVMGEVSTPDVLLPPNASPHDHSLRPSEAAALARADLVVWIGPDLTPWMAGTITRLAGRADILTLAEAPGTTRLPLRTGPDLAGRVKNRTDPHLWLDPDNAAAWLDAIAGALTRLDPAHASTYAANARAGQARITAARDAAARVLAPVRAQPLLLDHDWFQYFQARFGLNVVGALSGSEAAQPGPARLLALARIVRASQSQICILAEPPVKLSAFRPVLGSAVPRVAEADPLGSALTPGPDLYPALIGTLAEAIASCARGQ